MIQKQNKIKTALCKNVLAFTIFLFAGTTVVNAQLSPVLIQREALLRPVLKQELLSLRSELAARNVKFEVGATEVADRPLLAITGARRTTINPALFNSRLKKQYPPLVTNKPKSFSMLRYNLVTPIRDQGFCGSCWNFALVACAETNYLMKYSKTDADASSIDFSEQQIMCNANVGTCEGGYSSGVAKWLFENEIRMLSEKSLPYKSGTFDYQKPKCPEPTGVGVYRVVDFGLVPIQPGKDYPEVNDIKQAILEHGAVTAAFYADMLVFKQIIRWYAGKEPYDEQKPISTPKDYIPQPAGHQVAIVGWDDAIQCWIIKNSWGTSWGDNGYGLFRYGAHKIGSDATWVEVEKIKIYSPKVEINNPSDPKPPSIRRKTRG